MSEVLAREVAALLSAAGVVLLLVPIGPESRASARRAAGLILTLAGWALMAGSLIPGHDARRALHRLEHPVAAGAAVLAVIVGIVVVVLLVRLILAKPWVWFGLLAVALPVRFPVSLGSQQANLLVPLYAVLLLGLAAWLWGRLRGRLPPDPEGPTAIDVPLAALVGFALLSVLWSDDGTQAAVKTVFFYLPFLLLYRLVVAWWRQAPALRVLAWTTVGMAVPVALLAVGQYLTRDVFWNHRLQQSNVYSRFFRVNGIFYDPNILGRYLVLALLICAGYAYASTRPRTLAILGASAVVLAAGLVVTFSRSSALGLMVGLAMLAWRAYGWRRTLAVGGALLVILAAAAVIRSPSVRDAVTSSSRLQKVSEGRFDLVKGGLQIWRDNPVIGTGLGSFEKQYKQSLTPSEQRKVRVVISHNTPVTVLTEVGAVGFALFLLLIVATWLRIAGDSRVPGPAGWASWVILAMLTSIFVHSLLYAALFEDPYTWVLVGAAVGLASTRREAEAPAPTPPRPVPVA